MRPLEFDLEAEEELAVAVDWYERQRAGLGLDFLEELDDVLQSMIRFPHMGTSYEKGTRRRVLQRFPFAVVYMVLSQKLRVIAVTHLHRKPGYWWERG